MSPDPRLPVLVGLGEVVHRPADPGPSADAEPAALMAAAVRAALEDSGGGDALLDRVGAVGAVPSAGWTDGDPGRRVGELLGRAIPTVRPSMQGGNGPQLLVNVLAQRIQDGALDAAIVCGAEALSTLAGALKRGEETGWPPADPEQVPGETLEEDRPSGTEAEIAVGLIAPIMAYPLIENAIRASLGRTRDEHQREIAALWSRFSAVAATQPAAWTPHAYSAAELATPSPANRQVTLPYTKLLNANIQVDQGAAVVLCSVETARAAGIPADRWVFVHAGARATDEWFVSHRHRLDRSPAIRAAGRAALARAGVGVDDLGPIDLYSCFPAAVELAAEALGLPLDDPSRPLTATGGLTFFGGPGNNYATHGIVAVARALREADPGTVGVSTALGWYATKHAIGVYGNAPPARPFVALDAVPEGAPAREVAEPGALNGVAETATLIYDREGRPSYGILFALLPDGRRALGHTTDAEVMAAVESDGFLGSPVTLAADRSFGVG